MKDFTGNGGGTGTTGGPGGPGGSGGSPFPGGARPTPPPQSKGGIDPMDMVINYNEKFAHEGKILFRDDVVRQVMAVLIGKKKPNCALIGPAGVGKTKIVEDIAFRIASNDPEVPDQLKNAVIYELPLSNIVSGSRYVGDLEEKLKSVMDFMADPANHAILFIDEIHQLAKTSNAQTYGQIAQILKPALARGDIKTIGATTTQEANTLLNDPALNRRFSRIIVDEFTNEQTVEILKNIRPGFTTHYGNRVAMTDDLMETVVALANEYSQAGSHRPDNAITLLDRACGEAIITRKKQEAMAQNDPALMLALQSMPVIQLTERQIKRTAISIMTGNAQKKDFDIDTTRQILKRTLKGQDDVIEKVLKLLRQYDMDLFPKTKPMTIMFSGNSGVGKTEMTKIIAQELTGNKPIILNMTEYHSPASINRIIGSPDGYVGSDSDKELPFDGLESNPYQVILLDEFEKGDKSVQRLFMSAFDEGYIKTSKGKTLDFTRTIIIATTNAGHTNRTATIGFNQPAPSKAATVKSLKSDFDIELLNRFRDIIEFHPLDKDIYREILANQYREEAARIIREKPHIKLVPDIPDDDLDRLVAETYVPEFGARPANKTVRDYIESQV